MTRSKRSLFCLAVTAWGWAAAAQAQTYLVRRVDGGRAAGFGVIHLSRAAVAGERVRLWFATLTNPDCSPAGTMHAQILTPPRHGEVDLSYDPVFPDFMAPNPRVLCDRQKVDGVEAFYTPAAGFHGHDRVVLQNATSEGRVRRVVIDVDVR